MNPFRQNIFDLFKTIIRTTIWLSLVVNTLIISCGLILFTFKFTTFFSRWMLRTWFDAEWGVS